MAPRIERTDRGKGALGLNRSHKLSSDRRNRRQPLTSAPRWFRRDAKASEWGGGDHACTSDGGTSRAKKR